MQVDTINKVSQARLQEIYAAVAEVQDCLDGIKYVIATYDEDNRLDGQLWTVPSDDEVTAEFKRAVGSVNTFLSSVKRRESELLSRDWRN